MATSSAPVAGSIRSRDPLRQMRQKVINAVKRLIIRGNNRLLKFLTHLTRLLMSREKTPPPSDHRMTAWSGADEHPPARTDDYGRLRHCDTCNRTRSTKGCAMSRALPFTKAKLRRAIDVAREKGFRVLARPDGTLVFEKDSNPQANDGALEQGEEIVL
jgi:hypothetical protein